MTFIIDYIADDFYSRKVDDMFDGNLVVVSSKIKIHR